MRERIREEWPSATVELIESGGGAFEVERDGTLVFSKNATGRHTTWDELRALLADASA